MAVGLPTKLQSFSMITKIILCVRSHNKHTNSFFFIIIAIHRRIIYLVLGLCIMNNERMTWPFDFGKQIYECAMEKKTTDIPLL